MPIEKKPDEPEPAPPGSSDETPSASPEQSAPGEAERKAGAVPSSHVDYLYEQRRVERELRDAIRKVLGSRGVGLRTNYADLADQYRDIAVRVYDSAPSWPDAWGRSIDLQPQINEFEAELAALRREVDTKAKALVTERAGAQQKEEQIQQLQSSLSALNDKQRLAHLLSRVGEPAQRRLLEDGTFRDEFVQDAAREAYVLSIDIRRSTELMLKAREPKLFAQFIITLATRLRQIVLDNFGVFDKFTGDGVLAFFPLFYSGRDAGYRALKTAALCHEAFAATYKAHRHCFSSILVDTGLGVGLDYGAVQVVQIGADFTVVGTPVVYACRMSGARAGETLVNQPAFEHLFNDFSEYCDFQETEVEIKHEGSTLAHRARLNGKPYDAKLPDWLASVAT